LGIDIGNVIMAQLITETFLRTEETKTTTWRLVVDEFHEFVGENFATIINEARSYNVFPVLAHQDRSQIDRLNNRTLKSAVGHAGLKVLMAGSPEDRVAFASLFGRDRADLVLGLNRFTAMVSLMDGLAGTRQEETLVLDDWWGAPVPGQLVELQQAARPHTIPKREVVRRNNQRYWDRLDAAGAIRQGAPHEQPIPTPRPPGRKASPGARPSQSRPGKTPAPGGDPPRRDDAARPRPSSLLDLPPDFETPLPGDGGGDS